jgi:hypothetical protein
MVHMPLGGRASIIAGALQVIRAVWYRTFARADTTPTAIGPGSRRRIVPANLTPFAIDEPRGRPLCLRLQEVSGREIAGAVLGMERLPCEPVSLVRTRMQPPSPRWVRFGRPRLLWDAGAFSCALWAVCRPAHHRLKKLGTAISRVGRLGVMVMSVIASL